MPEEKKLGTKITYLDPDGNGKPVEVLGVPLAPNKAIDLVDFVDEGEAERMATKLAGNPYFKVEGGPDHSKAREKRAQRLQEQEAAVQQAFERNKARRAPEPDEPEAPDSYDAPTTNTLEGAPARTAQDPNLPPQPRSSRRT